MSCAQVVKIPRFDLKKFQKVSNMVGSAMKSVGEVMAIGRKFEEVFQKALRMLHPSVAGFEPLKKKGDEEEKKEHQKDEMDRSVVERLKIPDYERVFAVADAFDEGMSVDEIHDLCKIDRWFLHKLKNIDDMRKGLIEIGSLDKLDKSQIRALKCYGFSDLQIAARVGSSEVVVRRRRCAFGITPFVKQIDTLAAEYPAQTNYLYMTYNASEDDVTFEDEGIMVLGCGPYCIGSSVEFDWCAVNCVRELREQGFKAISINYNPETVSTDYDESDKLYFEELSFERVVDIYERERSAGVVVSVGGQIPQNIAMQLHKQGVNVLGTNPEMIDKAEDRNKFSDMLDSLGIDQPPWFEIQNVLDTETMQRQCEELGYPVLVRPSYVLSGAAMRVASNYEQLDSFLKAAVGSNPDHPVVVSKFILNAKEVEFDGVAQDGKILNYAISEHVENAGVHSGDATLVLPAQKLYVETIRRVKRISQQIVEALQITGPFNIQYMSRDNEVKVIECNLRASRTFPFISKTMDFNFIRLATRVMVGIPSKPHQFSLLELDYVGIKAPQFSFGRLDGADPTIGVEMASTGEVACFGRNKEEAFLLAIISAGFKMPEKTRNILIALGPEHAKAEFLESARTLVRLQYNLFATGGTHEYLTQHDVPTTLLHKPLTETSPNVKEYLKEGKIDLVINVQADADAGRDDYVQTNGFVIRRTAVDFGVSLIINIKNAVLFCSALDKHINEHQGKFACQELTEFYRSDVFDKSADKLSSTRKVRSN